VSTGASLIIFGGLPGVGKSTLARALALQLKAAYVRVDSLEQALLDTGHWTGPLDDAGYRLAYAVTLDNLRLGLSVVADSVNPISVTRRAWRDVSQRAGVRAIEVQVVCSDRQEHERRVSSRVTDIAGLRLPSWSDVLARERESEPWQADVTIDTAGRSIEQSAQLVARLCATPAADGD
jgi:predicted kinase